MLLYSNPMTYLRVQTSRVCSYQLVLFAISMIHN